MIKKLSIFVLLVALALVFWVLFALWVGLYSVYSIPPSKDHPDGVTYIINRDDWEPLFNSPDYKPPPKPPEPERKGGIGFGKAGAKPKRPVQQRIVVELPYIEWAYEKSVEKQKAK